MTWKVQQKKISRGKLKATKGQDKSKNTWETSKIQWWFQTYHWNLNRREEENGGDPSEKRRAENFTICELFPFNQSLNNWRFWILLSLLPLFYFPSSIIPNRYFLRWIMVQMLATCSISELGDNIFWELWKTMIFPPLGSRMWDLEVLQLVCERKRAVLGGRGHHRHRESELFSS